MICGEHMAKTIAVSDEVYRLLSQLKLRNESFTDVIKRLLPPKNNLSDIAGNRTFTREEWSIVQEVFSNQDTSDRERKKMLLNRIDN